MPSIRAALLWMIVLLMGFSACKKDPALPQLSVASINPNPARTGDTVRISGSGFIERASQNGVIFTSTIDQLDVQATVVGTGKDYIDVLVPSGIKTGKVAVEVNNSRVMLDFTYDPSERPFTPVLLTVSASNDIPNAEIELTLDIPRNLIAGDQAAVLFGDRSVAGIIQPFSKRIKATVPALPPGEVALKVILNNVASTNTLPFTVDPEPEITISAYYSATFGNGKLNLATVSKTGTDHQALYNDMISSAWGIALDKPNGYMYVGNQGNSSISRVKMDGSSSAPEIMLDAASGVGNPMDIAVAGNTVYFLNVASSSVQVSKGSLSGGNVQTLYTFNDGFGIGGLKKSGDNLYWVQPESGTVKKGDINGGNSTTLFQGNGLIYPSNIAIDEINQNIYIVSFDDNGINKIFKGKLDGSGSLEAIATLTNAPGSLTVDIECDAQRGFIYWTLGDASDKLMRAKLDGSGVEVVIPGLGYGGYFDLDIY